MHPSRAFTRCLIPALLCLLSCASGAGSQAASPSSSPAVRSAHVLVIGLDGVRSDALQVARTPHLDRLVEGGLVSWDAYAGGVAASPDGVPHVTQQATSSGPGWSSILTGVWSDKHRVLDNSFEGNELSAYPHVFVRLREARPHEQRPSRSSEDWLVLATTDHTVIARSVLDHLGIAVPEERGLADARPFGAPAR